MDGKQLKLGIIGLSEGNGHPYSWSAICNGFDKELMNDCPFPVIPQYLTEQQWPEAKLQNVMVTHIWTQNREISEKVAKAARILEIVDRQEDLIGKVDAVLLARDDAENHFKMSLPFLKAGIPIFIDKPFALSLADANAMLKVQMYEGQIFTCSSLRYANELYLTEKEKEKLGEVRFIEAQIPKSWEKYAVHLLEPIVAGNKERGAIDNIKMDKKENVVRMGVEWENLQAYITTYGEYACPLQISYFGETCFVKKTLTDTFSAFRNSISTFVSNIGARALPISRSETLEIVEIIESGSNA